MILPIQPSKQSVRNGVAAFFKKICKKAWHGTEGDQRRFRSAFGVSFDLCVRLWGMCLFPPGFSIEHFMGTLFFMKTYPTLDILEAKLPYSRKTILKYQNIVLEKLASLSGQVILWDNRYLGKDKDITCLITVDGTDFSIREPYPFASAWYSHKFKGPGLRYEVGICIQTGHIVWINGPYACGMWNDQKIFNHGLRYWLDEGERVEADSGYRGPQIMRPDDYATKEEKRAKDLARARHETVNRRFKQFNILNHPFRHPLDKHQTVFRAVAAITQLQIENGPGPFHVIY